MHHQHTVVIHLAEHYVQHATGQVLAMFFKADLWFSDKQYCQLAFLIFSSFVNLQSDE